MAWNNWGNPPLISTTAQPVANPSTATLCAELDSTQLGTVNFQAGETHPYSVTWILGADTNATWQCERAASTALNAGYADAFWPKTGTALTSQFVTKHVLGRNDRLRARIGGSTFAASVSATIIAEQLT